MSFLRKFFAERLVERPESRALALAFVCVPVLCIKACSMERVGVGDAGQHHHHESWGKKRVYDPRKKSK